MKPTTGNRSGAEHPLALAFANVALFAISIGSVAWCVYSVSHQKSDLPVRLAPALIGLAAPVLLVFKPMVRLIALSMFIGVGVGVYSAQLFALILTDPDRPALQATEKEARHAGIPFDGRTRVQAIDDFRSHGVIAYPPFYPYLLLDSPLRIEDESAIALSSISEAFTVVCNESGQYLTYTTDEHGFPNPQGSWSTSPIDVAIVGASSAVGECVPPADNLASQIRARYAHTVVVGSGGNGPLLELASIREYLPVLKPKRVLWIFSESTTPQYLESESHSRSLLRYLDPSYRQGLLEKQGEVNKAVAKYFEDGIRTEEAAESWKTKTRKFITLKDFRTVMYYYVTALTARAKPFQFNASTYERALREGQRTIAEWGGTVTLVYWPDSSRYAGICNYTPGLRQMYDHTHDVVVGIAGMLTIPVIDLSRSFPDLPASQSGKNTEYFYPYPAHFKPAGYHVAGSAILSSLESAPDSTRPEK
jgi:hypothetical protein